MDLISVRARRDLSLPGRRVHLLYVRTEERKKENLVYEKSQCLYLIMYCLSFQLTAFFLVASRIDDTNANRMITPAKGEPRAYNMF